MGDRTLDAINRLAKWRAVLAGWQLGPRPNTDPECQAVRDHREATLIHRAELSALTGLLISRGIFTADEMSEALRQEAELLSRDMSSRFPGFTAHDDGMHIDSDKAVETMKGWLP